MWLVQLLYSCANLTQQSLDLLNKCWRNIAFLKKRVIIWLMVIIKNSSTVFKIKFPPQCNYKFSEIHGLFYSLYQETFLPRLCLMLSCPKPPQCIIWWALPRTKVLTERSRSWRGVGWAGPAAACSAWLLGYLPPPSWGRPFPESHQSLNSRRDSWVHSLTQAKLLVISDDVLNLGWAERRVSQFRWTNLSQT